MTKKSILLVVENLPVPYDRRVWQEAMALNAAGWQVSVISPATSMHPKLGEVLNDIRIFRYPMLIEGEGYAGLMFEYVWSFLCIFFMTFYVAAVRGFNLINFANPPDIFFPILGMWRLFGKKTTFDHHDLTPELFITKYNRPDSIILKFFYFAERQTLRVVHKVMVTNESYKQIVLARGSRRSEDVVVVRNSPDPKRFSIRPAEPALRRSATFLIAFLGEIGNQDGVDVLLRAMQAINAALVPDSAHCLLMGGGPGHAQMVAYAKTIGVSEAITFTGRADNDMICRVLSSADIAVDPCPFSPHADMSTATKIMEYMFFSLPIVAFDLTETRRSGAEAIQYARINDEADFVAQILGLLRDPVRRETLGRRGRVRLDEELSWKKSSQNLVGLMNGLVETDAEKLERAQPGVVG